MYLETNRMILREFTIDDLSDFHEIFSDEEVMEHTEPAYTLDKSRQFLSDFCINREPKGGFAAVLKETGKVIGYVLFKAIDEPEIYEIGWIFNKKYWRRITFLCETKEKGHKECGNKKVTKRSKPPEGR